MERASIKLILQDYKNRKATISKVLAKPIITLFETIQGSKLG